MSEVAIVFAVIAAIVVLFVWGRIPVEVVTADPTDSSNWCRQMVRATGAVLAQPAQAKS